MEGKIRRKISDPEFFDMAKDDVMIKALNGTDVRDITLDIYMDSMEDDEAPKFKLNIYIVKNVTDLSAENLYVFSKGITEKKFIAFVPTFFSTQDEFTEESTQRESYEKNDSWIYNSKEEFSHYLY